MPIIETGAESCHLCLKVTPRAARAQIAGTRQDADGQARLLVKVTTAPEGGKANKAVIALLSKQTGLPKSAFEITSGQTARSKTVSVACKAGQMRRLLAEHL